MSDWHPAGDSPQPWPPATGWDPRQFFSWVSEAFLVVDRDWRYVYVNPQAAEMSGMAAEEMLGRVVWELFPALVGSELETRFRRARETGEPERCEFWFPTFGRWYEQRIYPTPDALIVFATDITDRKGAEEALRRNEERYRALAEASSQAIWAWTPSSTPKSHPSTQWWESTTGQTLAEQTGLGWLDRVHPDDRERVREAWTTSLATGDPYHVEYRLLSRGGEERKVLARAVAIREPDGRVREWVGTLSDVTEQRRAETDLRENALRLGLAMAAANLGDWSWEAATDLVTLSERAAAIFGLPPGPHLTWAELRGRLHPDDQEAAYAAVARAVAERSDYDIEFRVLPSPGSEMRWISAKGRARYVADDGAGIAGMIGVVQDVTARKRVEEELREADRRKNDFLAVLAHELRNPLAPLRNAAHVLHMTASDNPVVESARAMIERQVAHMARLLEDLLDVSRISRGKVLLRTETLDLVPLVRAAAEDLRGVVEGSGLALAVDLPRRPVWVEGDRTRLAQVVGNLLQNAAKFTNPGGSVAVALALEGGEAVLAVEDTGIGLETEILERLFEPFSQADRSLDRSRGGLGLGLALVKMLAELHGGRVEASSGGSGHGSRFTLHLPTVIEPEDGRAATAPAASEALRLRVLLVEDNPDVAESLALMLELAGHEVTLAATGGEGLAAAQRRPPDVALCDIGLPGGMDGYDLARALRASEATAGVRLIALSGYGQEEDKRQAREAGFDEHLTKPIDPQVLLKRLEERPEPPDRASGAPSPGRRPDPR